jgi:hypothetical protein
MRRDSQLPQLSDRDVQNIRNGVGIENLHCEELFIEPFGDVGTIFVGNGPAGAKPQRQCRRLYCVHCVGAIRALTLCVICESVVPDPTITLFSSELKLPAFGFSVKAYP